MVKTECHFLVYVLGNDLKVNGSGELEGSHLTCL